MWCKGQLAQPKILWCLKPTDSPRTAAMAALNPRLPVAASWAVVSVSASHLMVRYGRVTSVGAASTRRQRRPEVAAFPDLPRPANPFQSLMATTARWTGRKGWLPMPMAISGYPAMAMTVWSFFQTATRLTPLVFKKLLEATLLTLAPQPTGTPGWSIAAGATSAAVLSNLPEPDRPLAHYLKSHWVRHSREWLLIPQGMPGSHPAATAKYMACAPTAR